MEYQGVQQALINLSNAIGPGGWTIVYLVFSYIAMFFALRYMNKDDKAINTDCVMASGLVSLFAPIMIPCVIIACAVYCAGRLATIGQPKA